MTSILFLIMSSSLHCFSLQLWKLVYLKCDDWRRSDSVFILPDNESDALALPANTES